MAIGDYVDGELYRSITRKLFEIGRQVNQRTGYQFDAEKLNQHLQDATEGIFEPVAKRDWPIWKTIKIGMSLTTPNNFRRSMSALGYEISKQADFIIDAMTVPAETEGTELKLAMATGTELTGRGAPTVEQVFNAIKMSGGELLTKEDGMLLRLQYAGQPRGEWFFIAMERVVIPNDWFGMIVIGHYTDGFLGLDVDLSKPNSKTSGDYKWVFAVS